ncbi:hypothetical protein [Streptomyces sp. Isolate_45]|uniref:hypothetical protein n=1 Tax=Streptomyces sp. Isolate_45 TaxID=2950111 RepID=UPI002481B2BD|nr:hypothetical protein [Streptomyces sp. Isolate_45]MDA5283700.1 hypothetical protein [Streptomyces sp. Isolate_45]
MPVPRLVIYPPDENGWRRVRWDGQSIGVAHRPSDILDFLRDAGMEDPETLDLTGELVEWRGGGPETWAESPP